MQSKVEKSFDKGGGHGKIFKCHSHSDVTLTPHDGKWR